MECCENKNILKDKEMYFCKNCATIHGYTWIEYDFKFNEYNENIYNLLKCKNAISKRKKYLNKKYNLDHTLPVLIFLIVTLIPTITISYFMIIRILVIVVSYLASYHPISYIFFVVFKCVHYFHIFIG